MVISRLEYNGRIISKSMSKLLVYFDFVLELFNENANLFEVFDSEVYSVRLFDSLICDVVDGKSL